MSDVKLRLSASKYLSHELDIRKKRRPLYSLRAFARDLSISPTTLSDILKDKAGLSAARAAQIAELLSLTDEHQAHFIDLVQLRSTTNKSKQQEIISRIEWRLKSLNFKLSNEDYSKIFDWYHFAILEMIELQVKDMNVEIMAQRLGLTKAVVLSALKRLYKVNLIKPSGRFFTTTSAQTMVGDEDLSLAIQNLHLQMINKSQRALKTQDLKNRNFQSVTFSVRKKDIQDFAKDMNEMTQALVKKYHVKANKDLVYCLSQQFFSLEET